MEQLSCRKASCIFDVAHSSQPSRANRHPHQCGTAMIAPRTTTSRFPRALFATPTGRPLALCCRRSAKRAHGASPRPLGARRVRPQRPRPGRRSSAQQGLIARRPRMRRGRRTGTAASTPRAAQRASGTARCAVKRGRHRPLRPPPQSQHRLPRRLPRRRLLR